MERGTFQIAKGDSPHKDVYQIVNERIIKLLEQGTVPWHKPWADAGIPRNLISKRAYRGINVILLSMLGYELNYFLTYKQVHGLGGSVRTGEKPHIAVFWTFLDVTKPNPVTGEPETKKVPYLRYYMVYNVGQCEGISKAKIPLVPSRPLSPIPFCEEIAEKMPQRPLIKHGQEHRAFYDPRFDYVNMPKFSSFESAESYYSTLFHELVHSTGHHTRLDRKDVFHMEELNRLEAYSHEELVAEMGSCYLLSYAGIATQMEQSAAYINAWLQRLRSDRKFIFSASTQAQQAVDFILNLRAEASEDESQSPTNVGLSLCQKLIHSSGKKPAGEIARVFARLRM